MKKLSRLIVYVALALSPMLFSHCTLTEDLGKLKTSLDSVKIALGTPQFNTQAHLVFVDAATNLPIENQDVVVSVSGRDAALLFNNVGAHLTEYTGKWGMLDLVLDPHIDTSVLSNNPVEFIVTPKLAGYVGDPQKAVIINSGTNNVTIQMINLSAPPAGYYSSTNVNVGKTNSNGQISGGTPISLAPRQFAKGSSSLDMRGFIGFLNGTTLLDASGNILVGDTISCDYTANNSDKIYPGYLISLTNNSGKPYYKQIFRTFSVALQLYVKSAGGVKTPVANIGNNGGIILHLPKATIGNFNLNSGSDYKEGDLIDRWQTESVLDGSNVTSKKDTIRNNVLTLYGVGLGLSDTLRNVSDLKSTWGIAKDVSLVSTTLNINGVVNRNAQVSVNVNAPLFYYNGFLNQPFLTSLVWWKNLNFNNPTGYKQITFQHLAFTFDPSYFTLQSGYLDSLTIDPSSFINTATGSSSQPLTFTQNITVSEPIANKTDEVTANINLTVVSQSSPTIGIKPNVNIYVGVSGNMQSYTLKDGKTSLKLKLDQPYIVHGQFGTASAVGILTVKKVGTNYVGTFQLTMGSTPGAVQTFPTPQTADKTIDINYTIPVASDVFNQFKNQ